MTRYLKFALCVIFALVALVTVARADEEKFFDDSGNQIKFIDSGGDQTGTKKPSTNARSTFAASLALV